MITNSIEIRVGLRTEASLLRRGSTRRYWDSTARSEYTKGRNPKDSSAPEPLPEICRFLVRKRVSGPLLYFIASSSLLAILPKYTKQCMPCTSVTHNLQKCLPRIAAILDVTSGRGSPAAYQTILEPALTLVMPFLAFEPPRRKEGRGCSINLSFVLKLNVRDVTRILANPRPGNISTRYKKNLHCLGHKTNYTSLLQLNLKLKAN